MMFSVIIIIIIDFIYNALFIPKNPKVLHKKYNNNSYKILKTIKQ